MTTANKITIFRVICIPVFIVLMYMDGAAARYGALAVFVIASLSDFLDGYIARHYNQVSNFGKFMDPLADKILVITAMLLFVESGRMPGWVLALVVAREFAVSGLRMVAAGAKDGRVIAANMWGKVKTVLQMLTIIFYYFVAGIAAPTAIGAVSFITILLCWAVAAVTALSGGIYLWQNRSCFAQAK